MNSPVSVSTMAMVCCLACRSQPTIFISASFVPSLLVGYRKVYSVRCEADVVMTSVNFRIAAAPSAVYNYAQGKPPSLSPSRSRLVFAKPKTGTSRSQKFVCTEVRLKMLTN